MESSVDDYAARGPSYEAARRILSECEIPPSLEVFDSEMDTARKTNPSVSPVEVAEGVVRRYHRVKF